LEFNPDIKEEKAVKMFQDRMKAKSDRYRKIISTASSVVDLSKIREKSGVDSERWNRYEESLEPYMQKIKEVWEGREEYMAQKIRWLAEEYDNIVVITGAAHVSSLENKLEGLSIECVLIT
jgi:pheromone shutdown protein TraB